MTGKCEYCGRTGPMRVASGDGGSTEDMFVCDTHWKILQNPVTAVPFIRGVVTSKMRGTAPPGYLKKIIDKYVEKISGFRSPKPSPSPGRGA